MTGMKIAALTAFVSGGVAPVLAAIEPKDLEGLNPSALATIVSLASLGVLVIMVRSFIPAIRKLTEEMARSNAINLELNARMNVRPCLVEINAESAKREAMAVVDEAKRVAVNVVEDAKREALHVIEQAQERERMVKK